MKDIHDIMSWPPGEFIRRARAVPSTRVKPSFGLGMVVANDGVSRIAVLWGGDFNEMYGEYDVAKLNGAAIAHVE